MAQAETSKSPAVPPPTWGVQPFGKYHLVRKLAEGGMAEIFLAKQIGPEGFERDVVVKRMLADLTENSDFVSMFLDEARLAARLQHHNICQIYELGQADGHYYICMEYLAGEDFSTILRGAARKREFVPFSIVARIVLDAALGLHYAHQFTDSNGNPMNVVHRDISPSNIFVTFEGHVKLLDFGIAKAESRATKTNTGVVKGKYMYMAPEQARGKPADRRADIFALGINLYEALTRIRPFARESTLAIIDALTKGDFKAPRQVRPSIPVALEAVVLKALAVDNTLRYQTAREMADDLEKAMASNLATGNGVAHYVRELFGSERVGLKIRVPTLAQILKDGGSSMEALVPRTDGAPPAPPSALNTPAVDATTQEGKAVNTAETPAPVPPRTSARKAVAIAAVSMALVLAGAGAMKLFISEPEPVVGQATPVPMPVALTPTVLSIASEPTGAQITINGVVRGVAPVRIEALPPGAHKVVATLDGHEPVERTAQLERGGDRLTLVLSLPPIAAAPPEPAVTEVATSRPTPARRAAARGKLTVDTVPWTLVYEGKRKLGETPLLEFSLPAGTHLLRFVNEQKGINTSVEIEILPNKTTAKKLRF